MLLMMLILVTTLHLKLNFLPGCKWKEEKPLETGWLVRQFVCLGLGHVH